MKITKEEANRVFAEIKKRVELAAFIYRNDYGHALCPWQFDATELTPALEYVESVLQDWDLLDIPNDPRGDNQSL